MRGQLLVTLGCSTLLKQIPKQHWKREARNTPRNRPRKHTPQGHIPAGHVILRYVRGYHPFKTLRLGGSVFMHQWNYAWRLHVRNVCCLQRSPISKDLKRLWQLFWIDGIPHGLEKLQRMAKATLCTSTGFPFQYNFVMSCQYLCRNSDRSRARCHGLRMMKCWVFLLDRGEMLTDCTRQVQSTQKKSPL